MKYYHEFAKMQYMSFHKQLLIYNLSSKKTVTKNAKIATSLKDKLFGLLLSSNPGTLIFRTRFGIHTLFLKVSTDILVLDKDLKVVKLKTNLEPNSFFFWNPKYDLVIEFPAGTIKKSGIKLGSTLKFC